MTFTTIFMSIIGILILLSVGALLLPRHIKVERNTLLPSGAKKVLELASSNRGYQQFNPYKSEDPNLKITHFGPETGVGSGFHFNGKDGKGSQTVASISDTSVQYNINLGAMGQPTQMIKAEPNKNGVLVTWQMKMDLGMNPISRVFGLFMDEMVGKTFEKGLTNLARVV